MDLKTLLLKENDRVKDNLTRVCEDLTDAQVNFAHEAVDERGIAHVVFHAYSALAGRAAMVAGRPASDTVSQPPKTAATLMAFIARTHEQTAALVGEMTEAKLTGNVVLRGGREMPGIDAMMQSFSHAYRHVGNILDARHLGGFETHALG